jgi:hypothetical protein
MATTPNRGYPRPELPDPADIEVVGQALDLIDADVDSVIRRATGSIPITPDGSGNFTWNHGLPWTPIGLAFTPIVSSTFLNPPIVMIRSDGLPNATRVLLRIVAVSGTAFTSSFQCRFVAMG